MANVRDMGSPAKLGTKNITVNGTYNASSDNLDGFSQVSVDVPQEATLGTKSITANGTYNASSDSLDGYSQVSVAVEPNLGTKSITANGTYNASSDSLDGYSQVSVAVPAPVLGTKNITVNGTYTAAADNLDGFSSVTVAVPSGAGATITVSYSSSFYDKTMTCTKGGTTYTETTTSAGTTVFNVNDSGTWTITCNGVSRTVDVVLVYSTQMAITQTVTIYSAASDTVSFTDATGAKTVTTNADGEGSVSISFFPNSNITFTSSIAKNPSDLTADYSKTVTVDNNTTEVYVMPDNSLYWWGYNSGNIEDCISANGWSFAGYSLTTPTYNTNSISLSGGAYIINGIGSKNKITGNVYLVATGVSAQGSKYGFLSVESSKSLSFSTQTNVTSNSISKYSISANDEYVVIDSDNNRAMTCHALWYE